MGTNGIWTGWCDSTATTTTYSLDNTWQIWTTDSTSATTGNSIIWQTWTSTGINHDVSPEAIAAADERYRRQRAEHALRAREAEERRKAATAKARVLLESVLSARQKEQLQAEKFFDMVSATGKRYRIHYGTHGNVRLLSGDGKETMRFCAQPNGVPIEDAMAAQKLMLETDETAFLNVANATRM